MSNANKFTDLDYGRDARKRCVEAGAEVRNDSDNGACDAGSDETVFDRGRSGFAAQELSDECTHLTPACVIGIAQIVALKPARLRSIHRQTLFNGTIKLLPNLVSEYSTVTDRDRVILLGDQPTRFEVAQHSRQHPL
jgi:hypothetical protein